MKDAGIKGKGHPERRPARRSFLGILAAAVFLAGALPSCSSEGSSGHMIVRVDGIPISSGEFTREFEYHQSFLDLVPEGEEEGAMAVTEKRLKTRILSEMLIPMAAVKARYREKIPLLIAEAEEIRALIAPNGSNFQEIAKERSRDTNAKSGGSMGTIPRQGLPYPLSRMAFTHDEGAVVGPFLSLVGCHILFIESKAKSAIPAGDTVRASHILLPFEPDKPDFLARVLPEILKEAKVEVLDPDYEKYVSP